MESVFKKRLTPSQIERGIRRVELRLFRFGCQIPQDDLLAAVKLLLRQEQLPQLISVEMSREAYSKGVKRFRKVLIKRGHEIKHMAAFELLSTFWGFRNWNTMCAIGFSEANNDWGLDSNCKCTNPTLCRHEMSDKS